MTQDQTSSTNAAQDSSAVSAELKPCPMCDGVAHLTKGYATEQVWQHGEFHRVFCTRCQVRQLFYRTPEEAIAAWNRRATPATAERVGGRIDRRESIADNPDAMIILTQDYPRENKIRIVDAHTERNVRAAIAADRASQSQQAQGDAVRDAAAELIALRVGELPMRGWLPDNITSRRVLDKLAAALRATQQEGKD
jgi:hypothetical protein